MDPTPEIKGKNLFQSLVIGFGSIWLVGPVILVTACVRTQTVEIPAPGDIVVDSYDLAGFDRVDVADFFETEISQGAGYRVVVEAERALGPHLEVEVRGERLQVGLKSGILYRLNDASQRLEVTLPTLARARISNHSTLIIDVPRHR